MPNVLALQHLPNEAEQPGSVLRTGGGGGGEYTSMLYSFNIEPGQIVCQVDG